MEREDEQVAEHGTPSVAPGLRSKAPYRQETSPGGTLWRYWYPEQQPGLPVNWIKASYKHHVEAKLKKEARLSYELGRPTTNLKKQLKIISKWVRPLLFSGGSTAEPDVQAGSSVLDNDDQQDQQKEDDGMRGEVDSDDDDEEVEGYLNPSDLEKNISLDDNTSVGPGDSVSMAARCVGSTFTMPTHLSVTISKTPTPPLQLHPQLPVTCEHNTRLINAWDTSRLYTFLYTIDAAFAQSMKDEDIDGATFLTILGMMKLDEPFHSLNLGILESAKILSRIRNPDIVCNKTQLPFRCCRVPSISD